MQTEIEFEKIPLDSKKRSRVVAFLEGRIKDCEEYGALHEVVDELNTVLLAVKEIYGTIPRTIHMNFIFVSILKTIYQFWEDKKKDTFLLSEIRSKLTNTEYCHISNLCYFGLLYRVKDENGKKVKGGLYGMPINTIRKFLNNEWEVAESYTVDYEGNVTVGENRILISQIKKKVIYRGARIIMRSTYPRLCRA